MPHFDLRLPIASLDLTLEHVAIRSSAGLLEHKIVEGIFATTERSSNSMDSLAGNLGLTLSGMVPADWDAK